MMVLRLVSGPMLEKSHTTGPKSVGRGPWGTFGIEPEIFEGPKILRMLRVKNSYKV